MACHRALNWTAGEHFSRPGIQRHALASFGLASFGRAVVGQHRLAHARTGWRSPGTTIATDADAQDEPPLTMASPSG